jgi:hypothetical protein
VEPFTAIGRELSERWAQADLDERRFPALAVEVLEQARVHERCSQREVLRWVARTPLLPRQQELGFGQPPLTLYRDERIYIEALFWLDSTTTIHQHSFSGAFCVLEGSSVHATYAFRETQRFNEQLALGELRETGVELLKPGQVRPIAAGREFIHALFHLDHPTLSLVARTLQAPAHPIQYSYYPPGLALDGFWQPDGLARRLRVLDMLLESAHPELAPFAEAFAEGADATALTLLLLRLNAHHRGAALVAPLLDRARGRHGALAAALTGVLTRDRKRLLLMFRRGEVTKPDLRFMLALLLNVTGRARILALVGERYPDRDPVQTVMGWLREMHETPTENGNALGVDLDPEAFWVVEGLLEGKSEGEIVSRAAQAGRATTPARITQLCFMLPFNSVLGTLLADGSR